MPYSPHPHLLVQPNTKLFISKCIQACSLHPVQRLFPFEAVEPNSAGQRTLSVHHWQAIQLQLASVSFARKDTLYKAALPRNECTTTNLLDWLQRGLSALSAGGSSAAAMPLRGDLPAEEF